MTYFEYRSALTDEQAPVAARAVGPCTSADPGYLTLTEVTMNVSDVLIVDDEDVEVLVCGHCGEEYSAEARFCSSCGGAITEVEELPDDAR